MFYHVVMFKLKENSKENMEKAKALLLAMEGEIPQLKHLVVGQDELFTGRSYYICLISGFDSKEAMDEYQVHPYHVDQVLAHLRPMLLDSKACDFSA